MQTQKSRTITFIDSVSKQNAVAIVRSIDNIVGLCLSLEKNGDIEVFMRAEDCTQLIEALRSSIEP